MSLGDRIKDYERVTRHYATKRTPLIVRVDGRAFHTFTREMARPFDDVFMQAMVRSALDVAVGMQGFKAAYVQSDEATFLLTDYDSIGAQGWFDYNLSKVISISAASMSVYFMRHFNGTEAPAVFDSRAFNVPANDVVNSFLWRAQDWERNSLQMYARSMFSHKELHMKNRADIHEMLHTKGCNWATDITDQQRNGTFITLTDEGYCERHDVNPTFGDLDALLHDYLPG